MAINKITLELLDGYRNNRKSILTMISDLQVYVEQVKELLPKDTKDYRQHKYIFEQQIKSVTEFMKLIFDMRKEISKSFKDEIVLRDKLEEEKIINQVDLSTIMSQLDKEINNSNNKLKDIINDDVDDDTFN